MLRRNGVININLQYNLQLHNISRGVDSPQPRNASKKRKTANGKCEVIFTPTSSGVNILQRVESSCQYYQDDSGSVLKITLLASLILASFVL